MRTGEYQLIRSTSERMSAQVKPFLLEKNMITQERLKECINYDPDTGVMKWIFHHKRPDIINKRLGSVDDGGYIKVWIDRCQYRVHRLAFLYMNGSIPDIVDHIDGIRSNNKWENLRPATKTINAQNMKKAKSNSSHGFLGVYPRKKKFVARIAVDGVSIYIGIYETPEKAHEAYVEVKRKYHKGNTL